MKHLYYARHGESFINIRDIFATKLGTENDLGLTELGEQQALQEGKKAAADGLKIDLMVSSPLPRARETAEIIAREIGYPPKDIVISDLFIEIQYGELEGTSWSAWWKAGNTYADLGKFAGSETMETLQQRAQKAYEYLQSLPDENILVVSHSAFGRALRRVVNGQPYTDEQSISLTHGEIIRLA